MGIGHSLDGRLRTRVGPSLRSLTLPVLLLGLAVLASSTPQANSQTAGQPPARQALPVKQRIVQQGVAVEFSLEPVLAEKPLSQTVQEGDSVVFRFRISDATTGTPLTNLDPAAWMSLKIDAKTIEADPCVSKIKEFLGGSLFARPELDLNVYYVLALNHDATITVVDPLFGFGGSKLLALVSLKSPGEDWVLTSNEEKLFVSMPEANQVAVVKTSTWKVVATLDVKPFPARLALQPDGQYLWVAHGAAGNSAADSGVTIITVAGLQTAARIATGKGPHQIALSDDNRFAFVTNRDDDTVSIIDVRTLQKIKDLTTGRRPAAIAFSSLGHAAYVTHEGDGTIAVIDENRQEVVARMPAEPGLGQIKFAPGGRWGFVVNPEKDVVHIIDAASNRIVQTADVEDGPDQITFTREMAYVRHRGSETVLMIPLKEVGVEGKPVAVVDFPGGQNPFGKASGSSLAEGIVQAPGENAVLVANPADKAIYFYKEGMAAPMGNFSNYSREPRAVIVVDRSFRERSPGVYETTAQLRRPGRYDVALFLNAPRVVHCFEVAVAPNRELEAKRKGSSVEIEHLISSRVVPAGQRVRLQFKLTDANTKQPRPDLKDVRVLTYLAPGIWHQRQRAQPAGAGIYEISFVPPQPGIYYVHLECPSLGLPLYNSQYLVLRAVDAEGGAKP